MLYFWQTLISLNKSYILNIHRSVVLLLWSKQFSYWIIHSNLVLENNITLKSRTAISWQVPEKKQDKMDIENILWAEFVIKRLEARF